MEPSGAPLTEIRAKAPDSPTVRRVLVTCCYPVNRGDALLLESLEGAVSTAYPDAVIVRTGLNKAAGGGYKMYPQPMHWFMILTVLFGLRAGAIASHFVIRPMLLLAKVAPRLPGWLARTLEPKSWRDIRVQAEQADVCIPMAGGYLLAEGRAEWLWLSHLLTLQIVKSAGCPIISAPCSIGPFHASWHSLAKRIPRMFDNINVRDDHSWNFLAEIGCDLNKVTRTVDLGYAHPWRFSNPLPAERSLGVAVRYYAFGGERDPELAREKFEEAFSAALDMIASEQRLSIVFIPQDDSGTIPDSTYARGIGARMRSNSVEFADPRSMMELAELYAKQQLVIGVRMHACIMAVSAGVPIVNVAYEPKSYGAIGDLECGFTILDIRRVTTSEIYSAVSAEIQRSRSRAEIKAAADRAAMRALDFVGRLPARPRSRDSAGDTR